MDEKVQVNRKLRPGLGQEINANIIDFALLCNSHFYSVIIESYPINGFFLVR